MKKTIFKNITKREKGFKDLEKLIGVTLPQEYKDFISKFNGAKLYPDLFTTKIGETFLSDIISLDELIKKNIFNVNNDKSLMFVARDECGNGLLLSLKNGNRYYDYDHETSEHFFDGDLNANNYSEKLELVADTFEDVFKNPIFDEDEPELFYFIKSRDWEKSEEYINNFSKDINLIEDEYSNILDIALEEHAPIQLLKLLLDKGVKINSLGLIFLATRDNAEGIDLLLKYERFQYYINYEKQGRTPLTVGISHLSVNAIKTLLKNGAIIRDIDLDLAKKNIEDHKSSKLKLNKAKKILELVKKGNNKVCQ